MNTPIDRTTQKRNSPGTHYRNNFRKTQSTFMGFISSCHVQVRRDEKMRQIKGKISLRIKKDKNCLTNVTNIK